MLPFISRNVSCRIFRLLADCDGSYYALVMCAQDEWTSLPEISSTGSTARNKGATAVLGSKIFCIGGYAGGAVSDAMDVFDSTKGEWAQGPAMPVKRALHAAAAYNNKVYVFGGSADTPNGILSRTTGAEDSMLVFDIASSKWDTSYPTMYEQCRGSCVILKLLTQFFFWFWFWFCLSAVVVVVVVVLAEWIS